MVSKYNNYLQVNRHFLSPGIYLDGINNIKKSFDPNARKIIFSNDNQNCQSHSLNLQDRVQSFVAGILLLLPVVNLITSCFLRCFATLEGDGVPVHQSAGILPYAERNGKLYVLLGQERSGLWADFGGATESGEMAKDTAGREGWEESRGILGDLSKIREQVCNSSSIGKTHQMFFTKLTHSENVTNQAFQNLTFSDSCRMEKKEIAWVEAEKIFQAVRNKTNQFSEDGKVYRLRGCFAKSISEALSHPEYRQVIAKLSNKINAKVQCNNIASDCVLGICSEPTWAQSPVPFTKGNNNEWLGEVAPGKEFKFVILNRQNLVKWENGSNRQIYTPMGLAYSHPNFA